MTRVIFTKPLLKVLTVVGFVVGLGLIVYYLSRLPSPREQDRVGPENGEYSIIMPRDWEHKIVYAPVGQPYLSTIDTYQSQSIGQNRDLFVGQFREPPNIEKLAADGLTPGEFQGQPAYLVSSAGQRNFLWRAIFQRSGKWYEISLRLPEQEDIPNSRWWAYLNSFRSK